MLLLAAGAFLGAGWTGGAPPNTVSYGRDVRRILSDRCFQCHGVDPATREAGLRLDEPESALAERDGVRALVPGDPGASDVWQRITSTDPEEVMPPPGAKKRALSDDELAILRSWIEAGAEYEPHWAFVAPEAPAVPTPTALESWTRNPIDAFIARRLEEAGITPSEEADRATLLRRVFLDLTGLPPTPSELDAFLNDERDDAYERTVDALLSEEPYLSRVAERLATPWLDAARYADTIGIHTDNGRQMWPWRNWVLEAFRDNLPYDRFVIEQLAGDLLEDATPSSRVASGFNRNHVITDEGGAIPEEYLVEYAVDRASTTSTVFLGLTMGCARCHDHKFDPITQKDFYSFLSFFNSIDEPGLYTQTADSMRAYEPFIEIPSEDQQQRIEALEAAIAELEVELAAPLPREDEERTAFVETLAAETGVHWTAPSFVSARSSAPEVTLAPVEDGSIVASGPMAAFEDYTITLRTNETGLRAVLVEALVPPLESLQNPPPADAPRGAGRAGHGNAVVSRARLEVRRAGGEDDWQDVGTVWAWADHTQQNGDFEPGNLLEDGELGWAVDGNANAGERTLVLLTDEPFGFEESSELRVTLSFRSRYEFHSLGRLRFSVSPLGDVTRLPAMLGRWYRTGPFGTKVRDRSKLYRDFGPGAVTSLDPEATFGQDELSWKFAGAFDDGVVHSLGNGAGATYLARTIVAPSARELELSLGSDDGFVLYLNGAKVTERRVDRGAAPDQDTATLSLRAGANLLVLQIVNTGGPSGQYFDARPPAERLGRPTVAALLPADRVTELSRHAWFEAWRRASFDGYRQLDDERDTLLAELDAIRASTPRAMVMRERDTMRETFVLERGAYDHPDENRPVERSVPGFLPPLPPEAPRDRLGLARWLTSDSNPLFARVTVNRLWQQVFGTGLVATSEDFGLQGEWPSHPELLDWLAVHFRESGWNLHGLLRKLVTSQTYRQSSRRRPELGAIDPDNRLLHRYPRRRLEAEQIRDLALYTSGLYAEAFGGPSVKPYQPAGLWREVAMLASNTREFERGPESDLWRRSLYTYWKRAVPPPSLQTFDAPTRESCVIRRQATNTPLQALVLWNDVQFVEAARVLAQRVLAAHENDAARLEDLVRRMTARTPGTEELEDLRTALNAFRQRFEASPEDARDLLAVGEAAADERVEPSELAAWTMIASAVLNLHETLTQR